MKTIMRGLVVACCAALGLNAWAAVGDTLTYSTVDISAGIAANGGSYTGLVLTIPSQEGLPDGSVVTLQKIVAGLRNGSYSKNADYLVVLDGANNYANATACVQGDADPDFGNARPLTFDGYSCDLVVGKAYTCQFRDTADGANKAQQLYMFSHASSDDVLRTTATTTYSMLFTITAQVKTIADEPVTYTCTVDDSSTSWEPTLATLKATDSLVYTGSGTVDLPAGATIVSSITIGEGVTLNVTESGLVKSKVTNNGTIKVTGGEKSSPIVITEDQGADTTIGTIQIAANSCLKIDATGSGNKKYTVTGDSATTSTLILASNHDWGLTNGSQVRNAKVIVTHKCWWERTDAFDESVDLEMQDVEMVTCNNAYTVGSINGTGSFSRSGNSTITITQPRGNTIFRGTCAVPLTVSANTFALTGTLTGGLTVGKDAAIKIVPASGTCDLPTISANSVGKIILSGQGTVVNIKEQRVAFIVHDGAIAKIEATVAELAAGKITLPVPDDSSSHSLGDVKVVDANGTEVEITDIAEGTEPNTIVLTLQTNAPITESCNLSEKIDGKTGMIVVQGATGEAEAIAINVDCEIPEGLQLSVTGKADFTFGVGSAVSAGTIKLENGAVTTVSGTINNAITVQSGAKLVTSGAVTVAESVVIQTPGQKNSIVEIGADSTLTLTANNQIGTNVKVNVYGTLDIGATTLAYNNNPGQCEYNFYAGSVMTGTGAFKMTGGYTAEYYVRANESAANQFVTISVPRARDVYDCAINVNVDNGVGLKWLSSAPNNHQADITIKGSDVRGLEIQNATNVKFGDYDRGLRGAVVIGEGAKLTLSARSDIVSYNYDPKATFDIHGTLELNKRQTIFAANTIKMYDGAKIVGTGEVHSQILKAMDVCDNISIQVSGTVTIDAPLCSRDNGEKITFAKMDGAESASVLMKQTITGPGGLAINGAILTLPTDATKQVSSGAVAKIDGAVAIEGIESTTTYYPSANAAVAASSAEHPAIAVTDFTNSTDGLVHANQVLVIPTGITVTATRDMIWWQDNGKVVVEGTLNASCNTTLTNGSLELHEGAVVGGTGSLKVDSNKTIVVTGDASVANISILGSKTLTLDITAGKTLTVGNFTHTGSNKVEVPTGTLVVTANDAATGIVYEVAAEGSLTHELTALGQLIKVKAAEGATIAITSSADPETTELDESEPVDGVVTYTVVEKQVGPTSWDTITAEDLPVTFAGADLDAVKSWAAKYAGEFSQEALADLDVDAFLLDCAPANVETEKAKFKIISVENVDGEWIVKVAGNVGEGEKYGNGYVVIESVKTELFPEAGDDADFFQATLQVTAPVAE